MTSLVQVLILSAALTPSGAPAPSPAPASGRAAHATEVVRADGDGDWRGARWGMSLEEVLAAFHGEAFRVDPPSRLADGNVVAAGIDGYAVGPHVLQVRFVFEAGKLALVSLRTPPDVYAGPETFSSLRSLLAERLGGAGESTTDDAFIDMRQTRWK